MNIPSIPTDNLYKFLAIFGLIIFLASIYLNDILGEKIHNTTVNLETIENRNKMDSIGYSSALNRLEKKLKNHDHNYNSDDSDIIPEFEEYQLDNKKYINSFIEMNSVQKNLSYYLDRQMRYSIYSIILMIVSLLCIIVGFRLWYIKHQIFIDAERKWKGQSFIKLLKDAEAIKNESNSDRENINDDEAPVIQNI